MGLGDQVPDAVEGANHSDVLLGRSAPRPDSALYLKIEPEDFTLGRRGIRTPRHTFLVERREAQRITLFDNESDPYQMRNVADEQPAHVEKLTRELNGWLARTGDPWGQV
jgi:N-acetylglucosamine-6-sulfatase